MSESDGSDSESEEDSEVEDRRLLQLRGRFFVYILMNIIPLKQTPGLPLELVKVHSVPSNLLSIRSHSVATDCESMRTSYSGLKVDDRSVVVNSARDALSPVVGSTNKIRSSRVGRRIWYEVVAKTTSVSDLRPRRGSVHETVGGSRAMGEEQKQNRGGSQIEEPVGRAQGRASRSQR
jgi:hypothetical protein